MLKKTLIIWISLFLVNCTPDEMEIDIYTSDIEAVSNGEKIDLPVKISFSMFGDDKDNDLEKAKNIAKNYLSSDTKFSISKGEYSQFFIVETTLPFQSKVMDTRQVGGFLYVPDPQKPNYGQIKFTYNNNIIKEIDTLLSNINIMISLNLPAKNHKLRVISDSKELFEISSYAAWISKKPHIKQSTILKKRENIELNFKGGTSSIYSQIPIFINVGKK